MATTPIQRAVPTRRAMVAASVALLMTTAAFAQGAVPVTVGQYADYDACSSQGQVTGLNAKGDNFLAVRAGPGADYEKVAELHTGDVVNVCETADGWLGIVYARHGEDCGVGTPLPRGPYAGACSAGWVSAKYVVIIAG